MLLSLVLIRPDREVPRFSFACLTLKIHHLEPEGHVFKGLGEQKGIVDEDGSGSPMLFW